MTIGEQAIHRLTARQRSLRLELAATTDPKLRDCFLADLREVSRQYDQALTWVDSAMGQRAVGE